MFERYTEKARRVIFLARYEASQFGSPYIETEHLLLGLLREDKPLVHRFLRASSAIDAIRKQIEAYTTIGEKLPVSVDLPLRHESKRVLAYAAEESERLKHKHIGPPHLLLGLLREHGSFAAQLLREQGLTLDFVREQTHQSEAPEAPGRSASIAGLDQWLAELEPRGIRFEQVLAGNTTTRFELYAAGRPEESEDDMSPSGQLAQIRKRIDFIVKRMEHAIASHEFEKARFYSDEERKERENMRRLCEQFGLEEPPARVPLLCIGIIRDDPFSEVLDRCGDYIARGVAEVWLLNPGLKSAYTVTKAEGLREFKGDILRLANPPLEMDPKKIFD